MAQPLPQTPPQSLRYRRAAVRDLAWLVLDGAIELPPGPQGPGDPPLAMVRLSAAERSEFSDLLQQWDAAPDDTWLGAVDPRLRLGLYCERLIGAWLAQCGQIRLLARNWPLRVNRITLGEADFLVERSVDGIGQRQLWELACKFYLGVPDGRWLGPGLNDSLAAKLARVRGHQMQLIHQAGFEAVWGSGWSSRAWLAGWLLHPAAVLDDAAPGLPPLSSATSRIPAVWAEVDSPSLAVAARHARDLGVTQWWLLPKRRWLRPIYDDEAVATVFADLADAAACFTRSMTGDSAESLFEASDGRPDSDRPAGEEARPLMLAGIRWSDRLDSGVVAADDRDRGRGATSEGGADGNPDGRRPPVPAEVMRLMVVPPGWLLRALAIAPLPDSAG